MDLAAQLDSISMDALRTAGSMKWSRFDGDVIGAFVAEMDFGTAPAVTDALHEAVGAATFGYLPEPLVAGMADACAAWQHRSYGWEVEPRRIRPLPDVIRGLEVAIEHFSAPGSPVILPVPAYMPFFSVPGTIGRDIIQVPMTVGDDGLYRFDLDALSRAFTAGGHLLILCNPCNPVGRVFEEDELSAVAEVVDAHGGRVFSDEIHSPLVYAPGRHVPYASLSATTANHTITATSASKAWNLPGLKCAQLILTNDDDAARWSEIEATTSLSTSTLGVVANIAAYRSGAPWLDEILDYLDGNRRHLADLLAELLPAIRYTPPQGTYLAWLDCRELGLGDHPGEVFREQAKVALVDGVECGVPGHVRLNFATPRPILTQILHRLATTTSGFLIGG